MERKITEALAFKWCREWHPPIWKSNHSSAENPTFGSYHDSDNSSYYGSALRIQALAGEPTVEDFTAVRVLVGWLNAMTGQQRDSLSYFLKTGVITKRPKPPVHFPLHFAQLPACYSTGNPHEQCRGRDFCVEELIQVAYRAGKYQRGHYRMRLQQMLSNLTNAGERLVWLLEAE